MVHIEKLKSGKFKVVIGGQTWGIYSNQTTAKKEWEKAIEYVENKRDVEGHKIKTDVQSTSNIEQQITAGVMD